MIDSLIKQLQAPVNALEVETQHIIDDMVATANCINIKMRQNQDKVNFEEIIQKLDTIQAQLDEVLGILVEANRLS